MQAAIGGGISQQRSVQTVLEAQTVSPSQHISRLKQLVCYITIWTMLIWNLDEDKVKMESTQYQSLQAM